MCHSPFDLGLSRTIIVVMVQYRMRYLAAAHSNANTAVGKKQYGKVVDRQAETTSA
jgi:hypothetical protein